MGQFFWVNKEGRGERARENTNIKSAKMNSKSKSYKNIDLFDLGVLLNILY